MRLYLPAANFVWSMSFALKVLDEPVPAPPWIRRRHCSVRFRSAAKSMQVNSFATTSICAGGSFAERLRPEGVDNGLNFSKRDYDSGPSEGTEGVLRTSGAAAPGINKRPAPDIDSYADHAVGVIPESHYGCGEVRIETIVGKAGTL